MSLRKRKKGGNNEIPQLGGTVQSILSLQVNPVLHACAIKGGDDVCQSLLDVFSCLDAARYETLQHLPPVSKVAMCTTRRPLTWVSATREGEILFLLTVCSYHFSPPPLHFLPPHHFLHARHINRPQRETARERESLREREREQGG